MMFKGARYAPTLSAITLACACVNFGYAQPLGEADAVEKGLARAGLAHLDDAERAEAQANVAAVKRLANPSVELARESAGGESEWQVRVVQPLDLSGQRGALRAAAREEVKAIDADVVRRRQERIAEIRSALVECAAASAQVTIQRGYLGRLARAERSVIARTAAGDTAVYDLRRVRVAARSAEAAALLGDGERKAECASLAQLTGVADPQVEPAALTSISIGTPVGTARPDIVAREQRLLAASQRVRAARAARLPQLELGGGIKRVSDGTGAAYGPVVSVGVTLPLFDGGGAAVQVADARQRALAAELEIARRKVDAEQSAAAARAEAARDAAIAAAGARDDAARLGTIAETAYQSGEVGVVELLDGVCKYMRMPRVVRRQTPSFEPSVLRAIGRLTDATSKAEARKPTEVPPNSQWKLITVNKAAASAGLSRLSRS